MYEPNDLLSLLLTMEEAAKATTMRHTDIECDLHESYMPASHHPGPVEPSTAAPEWTVMAWL